MTQQGNSIEHPMFMLSRELIYLLLVKQVVSSKAEAMT